MERKKVRMSSLLLLLVFLSCELLCSCDAIEEEGRVLLRFKEGIEFDPYEALSNWGKQGFDHCFWYGVDCSADGRVVSLNLRDLCLEGMLIPEIRKLLNLKSLILHNNSFSGTVPIEIAELSKLEVLDLGQNNFGGIFPVNLVGLASLKVLILENNRFDLTSELEELVITSESQVNEHMLCSNQESFIRNFESATLRKLLQQQSIRRQPTRRRNKRTREVENAPSPSPIHSHSPSPSSSFSSSQFSLISPSSQSHSPSPVPPFQSSHKALHGLSSEIVLPKAAAKQKKTHWVIFVAVGCGSVLLAAAFSLLYFLCFQNNQVVSVMPWKTGLSGQLQKALVTGVPSLKRTELEIACEDFSNVIGTLSGCSFYKGTLSSGVEIGVTSTLIKLAKDWPDESEAQFRNKISVLSRVNHKNFMNLIGYCEEQEPFTRMMVYEYAPNGTLFEHLHISEAEPLDWTSRLRVAMGIAYCLEHMQKLDPPVILRSLNSSMIYLTEDYAAKISDLLFWDEDKEAQLLLKASNDFDSPLSSQEDIVYKFGILLLELVSGRLPFSKDDGLLVLWASSHLSGKRPLDGIVDPNLKSVGEKEIAALCDVIRCCIKPKVAERPKIADVVAQLRGITSMSPEAVTPKVSPLWWAELEIVSTES